MTIIGGLLPGLRDLRGPVAAGLGWGVFLLILLVPHTQSLSAKYPQIVAIQDWTNATLGTYALLALPILIYILGIAANYLVSIAGRILLAPLRQIVRYARRKNQGIVADWFIRSAPFRSRLSPISREAIERARLVRNRTLPEYVADEFPIVAVLRDARATELRLSKENPDQFQVVDRLRAEAEFRSSAGVPLTASGALFLPTIPILAVGLVLCGVIMLWQGLEHYRRANEALWTAAYLKWTSPPILEAADEWFKTTLGHRDAEDDDYNPRSAIDRFLRNSGVDYQVIEDFGRASYRLM